MHKAWAQSRALHSRVALLVGLAIGGLLFHGCTEAPPGPQLASELAPDTVANTPQAPALALSPVPKAAPKHSAHVRIARNTERKAAIFDPAMLVGMAPPAIGNILGKPVGTREVALTTEWTYATPSCSLVIFFYPDIATGALHALKYNVTDAGDTGDGANCIHHILLARSDDHD